jgi:sensor histidine kinase YesM
MDTVHTTKQKCEKVQALINAVHKINNDAHDHKYDPIFMRNVLESLSVLADEAQECLESISKTNEKLKEDNINMGWELNPDRMGQ